MKVIILRGISGCGKSTWTKNHHPNATIASADDSFRLPDGTYDFSNHAQRIHAAHLACFQAFIQAILRKDPFIIVDNTNLQTWEISPYVMPAQSFGYEVTILTIVCDPEVAIARKDWNAPEKIRRSAKILAEEESRFPSFINTIHRKLHQDEL
jgi:predicted kinase